MPLGAANERRIFLSIFGLAALLTLFLLLRARYLPMTDLPQHAEQVFLISHHDDPSFAFRHLYQIDRMTPYGLALSAAALLAPLIGVMASVKALVIIGVIGLPLAMLAFIRLSGGDEWWSLLGFPIAFGFAFTWGFLNYIVPAPLAIVAFALIIRLVEQPSWRLAGWLAAAMVAMFFLHAVTFGLLLVVGAGAAALAQREWRQRLLMVAPFVAIAPLAAGAHGLGWIRLPAATFDPSAILDLWQLPSFLIFGRFHWLGWALGVLALAAPLVGGVPHPRRLRWAPLGLTLIFCVAAASTRAAFGAWQRTAIFLLPALVLLVIPRPPGAARRASQLLSLGLAVLLMIGVGLRLTRFDRHARQADALFERMEPNKRVLGLVFENTQRGIPGYLWIHFPGWYQSLKGGYYQYSFSSNYTHNVATQLPQPHAIRWESLSWRPERFNWTSHGDFDYFMVRSFGDAGRELFSWRYPSEVELIARNGPWWLYGRKMPAITSAARSPA